jgi:transporter family-2 protein
MQTTLYIILAFAMGLTMSIYLLIAGQILMAIIVSHFGLLESPKDPVNLKKMIGAILVLTGAIFSTY